MSGIVTVYATFADDAEARRVARQVVEEGLAACANVLSPCHSVYRWQGAVEEAAEVPVLFKTGEAVAPKLLERIGALHSYDVPAAMVWLIQAALPGYAGWVIDETNSA